MPTYVLFHDEEKLEEGNLFEVARRVRGMLERDPGATPQVFDALTSELRDVPTRGTDDEIREWIARHVPEALDAPVRRGRGRPKLGVVGREVTLLPRQWEWLAGQRGGASSALRRIVDDAMRDPVAVQRQAQDATYRFANHMAGDAPGFEDAMRALYAKDADGFRRATESWSGDVRDHARRLAAACWAGD